MCGWVSGGWKGRGVGSGWADGRVVGVWAGNERVWVGEWVGGWGNEHVGGWVCG